MAIHHKFSSAIPDGLDPTLIKPSNWNEDHVVDFNGLAKSVGGVLLQAVPGTDYLAPNGSGAQLTGITAAQVGLGNVTNESKPTMFTSPTFTGSPVAPTAAVNTNSTQLATCEFVLAQAGTATPLAPAVTAVVGVATKFAREDHKHPTNFTSTTTDIKMNGTQAVGTSVLYPRADHVHPVDTSRAPVADPTFTGTVTAPQFASTVVAGTAPFTTVSNTMVRNLNAQYLGGTPLSGLVDIASTQTITGSKNIDSNANLLIGIAQSISSTLNVKNTESSFASFSSARHTTLLKNVGSVLNAVGNSTQVFVDSTSSATIYSASAYSGILEHYGSSQLNEFSFYNAGIAQGTGTFGTINGFKFNNQAVTASAIYGAKLEQNSGTNKWNIYASGTANNYFNGWLGVGTSTPDASSKIQIVGNISIGAGTEALPALTTAGDTNTGVHFPAADTVGIATGGVSRFTFGSTGNFTSTNSSNVNQLTLQGTNASAGGTVAQVVFSQGTDSIASIQAVNAGSIDSGFLAFNTQAASGVNTERARITSTGALLVGRTAETTVPKLQVGFANPAASPTYSANVDVAVFNSSNAAVLQVQGPTSSGIGFSSDTVRSAGYIGYTHSTNSMEFRTGTTANMYLTSDGKLQIGGTTAASYQTYIYNMNKFDTSLFISHLSSTTKTTYNLQLNSTFIESDNTTVTPVNLYAGQRVVVPNTVTKTGGSHSGIFVNNLRNYTTVASGGDSGTAYELKGVFVQAGHFNSNASETPTTQLVKCFHATPYAMTGTISNMYGLFIGTQNGTATVTNKWGVYQEDYNYKNYFAGAVLVGTVTDPGYGAKIHSTAGISLGNTAVANGNVLDWYEEGTFTATATGMTTSPTGTVKYTRIGNNVTLDLPAITGTSNATTFTLTGMPSQLRPAAVKTVLLLVADNSGAAVYGKGSIGTDGILTINKGPNGDVFTASGVKTAWAFSISYTLQ